MRYLPTIDLWNPALHSAVRDGQIKLQPGQWVKCGSEDKSRFVCLMPGSKSFWVTHPRGDGKITLQNFKTHHNAAKKMGYI